MNPFRNPERFYFVPTVCKVNGEKVSTPIPKSFVPNYAEAVTYCEGTLNESWEIDWKEINEGEEKDMQWTFAGLEGNWEYETFASKEKAIEAGKMEFDSNFLIATVEEKDHLHLVVDNIEEVDHWEKVEKPSMKEKLIKNLVWKCYEAGLAIDVSGSDFGSVNVWDHSENRIRLQVSQGATKDWHETPEDELIRVHAEVSKYIAEKEQAEHVEVETEVKFVSGGPVTDQERMMKDAGHKLSDFE